MNRTRRVSPPRRLQSLSASGTHFVRGLAAASTRVVAAVALVSFFIPVALGQADQTAARPDRGLTSGASYSVSDIENINLQNGNVNLSIPLASLPPIAGGKLKLTISASYNSKLWNVLRNEQAGSQIPYRTYVVDTPALSDAGGWQIGGGYALLIREARVDFDYQIPPAPDPGDSEAVLEYQRLTQHNWYKVVLRTPGGAEHELRPTGNHEMYAGLGHPRSYLWGHFKDTPDSTGAPMQYFSTDGTYLSAIMNPAGHASGIRWTVFLADGTQVIQYASGIQRIRDTNGNSIKIFSDANGNHYQDEQTGREIKVTGEPGAGQVQVWYQTVGGVWQHIDINYGQTTVKGKLYKVQDWNPNAQTETGENGVECTRHQELPATTVSVVREIVFPVTEPSVAGQRFSFEYNSDSTESAATPDVFFTCGGSMQTYTRQASRGMGALSRIVTPGGAVVDYTYTLASTHAFIGIDGADEMVKETITTKAVTHDGATDTWQYTIPNDGLSTTSSVSNPDGSTFSQHFFDIDPGFAATIGYDEPRAGLVYHTSNGLTETYRHWVVRGVQIASGSQRSSAINSFVDAEYTSFVGTSLMSAKKYLYDFNNNLLQVKEYDWFDSSTVTRDSEGVPTDVPAGATLLRTTNTSYYNSAPDMTSPNYYATRALASGVPSILNAVKETTTGPSIARFSYDNQAYGVPPSNGNLTTQTTWDDLDNKWITSSQTYGPFGNLATKTDPRGKVTQFFYDDATHALPNRVVVDPQNGTGQQTTTTAFDLSTGLVTSQTDPNGNISNIDYTNQLLGTVDPFGRVGLAISPLVNAGGINQRRKVKSIYEDSLRRVTTAADLNAEGDFLLKSRTTSDQLGQPVFSEQSENGSTYTITSQSVYQQMGKITFASNPTRNAGAPTDGWTRSTKDNFGRVVEVATFAGATQPPATGTNSNWTGSVTTTYAANFTTVTDQAERVRRSMVDGLGRLLRVDEPDANNNLGTTTAPVQPTSYTYDVFGNLRTVTQGAQTRTFTYDSLSRLRTAANPESGTITYTYDDNGNLLTKLDARSITTTYTYDALNRNTTVNYSDTTINPDITRIYDTGTNGKGRLRESYAGGNETSGANVEHTKIESYDALGRPLDLRQRFKTNGVWSAEYQTQRSYNLASGVTAQIYPSGRSVTYNHDLAGRLADKDAQNLAFTGNLGDNVVRTYSRGITYSPSGSMTQEQFGTDTAIYNKLAYSSRGQLAEIKVSTAPNDSSWNRGKFVNWYSLQCGGVACNATDNNGNLRKQETLIPNNEQNTSSTSWYQQFEYDSLNRLMEVHEHASNNALLWRQSYSYDRYGNRSINQAGTTQGIGINSTQAAVVANTITNRLYAPGETEQNHPLINYDSAGNQTKDHYSVSGVQYDRSYDAENRMTSSTATYSSPAGTETSNYTYNADGQRVRRKINGVETWQIHGLDGELLAEYAAGAAPAMPQKEYGYRNGQLLITATAGVSNSGLVGHWKFDENTGTTAADSSGNGNTGTLVSGATWALGHNGTAVSLNGVSGFVKIKDGKISTATSGTISGWVKINTLSNGTKIVGYGGSAAANVQAVFGLELRQHGSNYYFSVIEVPVDGTWAADSARGSAVVQTGVWYHLALTSDGSSWKLYVNGVAETMTNQLGSGNTGRWFGNTTAASPDKTAIGGCRFNGVDYPGINGLIDEVRIYDRVLTAGEIMTLAGGGGTSEVNWLVTDHLGTPRMVFDKTGSLAGVKRHDYLPFGEELGLIGGRTTGMGYSIADGLRQKFTQKERDNETGLDYFLARYYSSTQGRFTSADRYDINVERQSTADGQEAERAFLEYISSPQQWNRYAYALNNPLKYVDPLGEAIELIGSEEERKKQLEEARTVVGKKAGAYLYENTVTDKDGNTRYFIGIYTNGPNGKGPAFESINEAAGELAPIINDAKIVGLGVVPNGTTLTDDNGDTVKIGQVGIGTPGYTSVFKGREMIYVLDPSTKPGKIPGGLMSDGKPGKIWPGQVMGHELGHERGRMTRDPDDDSASLRFEEKVRKRYDPKGAVRKFHN